MIYTFGMIDERIHAIHKRFETVVKLNQELERAPRRWGTEEALSSTEIHLIEVIGEGETPYSVTELAHLLGVTKGAVSQQLKRLEKKGMAFKRPDPENASRSRVALTAKGCTAHDAHRRWHDTMDGGFKAYFNHLEPDKLDFLLEFLGRVEDFLLRALR
jgi:DNA-binding MarR family transcriptional regulator